MYMKTSDQPVLELGFGNHQCNWGVHVCGLYETEAERDEMINPYYQEPDEWLCQNAPKFISHS